MAQPAGMFDIPPEEFIKKGDSNLMNALPLHLRMYAEMLGGRTDTVMNDYFSDAELKKVGEILSRSRAFSEANYQNIVEDLAYYEGRLINGRYESKAEKEEYEKEIEKLRAKKKSYDDTWDRQSNMYADYILENHTLEQANTDPLSALSNDPATAVLNTLGRFKAVRNAEGDWLLNDVYKMDLDRRALPEAEGMRDYAEIFAKELRPNYQRPISIVVPEEYVNINENPFRSVFDERSIK